MLTSVVRLTERNINDQFGRSPYVLARVDSARNPAFHRGLAEYLDHRYPMLCTFGTISRADFSVPRMAEMIRTQLGPMRHGVQDGYYLFEAGYVVGQHSGQIRSASASYSTDALETALIERIKATPAGLRPLSDADREALRQLLTYFEPILDRKRQAAGFRTEEPPPSPKVASQGSSTPPPAAPARAADADAYATLGIPPTATIDEVRVAWREQLKLNHPDKVSHMSPALQEFAKQQTVAIMKAYDKIMAAKK